MEMKCEKIDLDIQFEEEVVHTYVGSKDSLGVPEEPDSHLYRYVVKRVDFMGIDFALELDDYYESEDDMVEAVWNWIENAVKEKLEG